MYNYPDNINNYNYDCNSPLYSDDRSDEVIECANCDIFDDYYYHTEYGMLCTACYKDVRLTAA